MLNVILWTPVAAAVLIAIAPALAARWIAVAGTLVTLGFAVAMAVDFSSGTAAIQYAVDESWIPDLGVRYQLGVDGISVFLVLITAVLWLAATLYSALRGYPDDGRSRFYYLLLGIGEFATLGAFLAQDLLLFVLFFDLMLVPFFFLIGSVRRRGPDPGDDEDDRLHARRLAADVGGGDRDGDLGLTGDGRAQLLDRLPA